jgi:hypothetical protein
VDGLFQDQGGGSPEIPLGTFIDIADKTLLNNPYDNLLEALRNHPTFDDEEDHVYLRYGESSLTHEALRWGEGVVVHLLAAGRKDYLLPDFIAVEEEGSVINNDSMVYRVQFGDFVAILMGDGEFTTEQFLQDHYSRDFMRAAVLKLGHHGSNDSNSERYIDYVDPIIGLIPNSVRENPGVEHPYVLSRLRNRSIDYYASDRVIPNLDRSAPGVRGDVLVWTDGGAFTVEVENIRFE